MKFRVQVVDEFGEGEGKYRDAFSPFLMGDWFDFENTKLTVEPMRNGTPGYKVEIENLQHKAFSNVYPGEQLIITCRG